MDSIMSNSNNSNWNSTQFSQMKNITQPNTQTESSDACPLLQHLNNNYGEGEQMGSIGQGTVPPLPLTESNEQPVTTTKVKETVITQRPNEDKPSSAQLPPTGKAFEAREVRTSTVEPYYGASRETNARINNEGLGPVALEPILQDDTVVSRGAEAVRTGLHTAQDWIRSDENQLKQKAAVASDTVKEKSQQASSAVKEQSQSAANTIKDKKQQATSAVQNAATATQQHLAEGQQKVQNTFNAVKTKVSETLQGNADHPGLIGRISGSVREVTNSAADGVRRTADNISKNESVQQTVPTVVEAATSSYYFATAFISQYIHSFRPFALALLHQPFYVQMFAGLSLITHGILPFLFLDKWAANTVLHCYVMSVFLSHLIFTSTGNLRLLFAAHLAMLPIMWSLFWETESQSQPLADLRDQIQAGNAMSLLTHPRAIRHYTYLIWTRAVGFVTTAIFTLDLADIDDLWRRSAQQRSSIAHSISKRLHQRNRAAVQGDNLSSTPQVSDETIFDEIPVELEETSQFDRLLEERERSDEALGWHQRPESLESFHFDHFMDDSHLTKQAVQSEEKPEKTFSGSLGQKKFHDSRRVADFSGNKQLQDTPAFEDIVQPSGKIYPISTTTTTRMNEVD